MKIGPIVLAITWGVLFACCGYSRETGNIQKGKQLYEEYCAACHGEAGVGQSKEHPGGGRNENGNRLAPALDGTGHAFHHPPSLLFRYIKEGSSDESAAMPSFGDQLSDDDIKSIIVVRLLQVPFLVRHCTN